jgi:hypothetical protein
VFTGDGLGNTEITPESSHCTAFRGRWLDNEALKARGRVLEVLEFCDDPGQQKRLFLSAGNITSSIRHGLGAMVALA